MAKHNSLFPKRNEVWWINFEPTIGGEIKKVRPAIIVSNDMANEALNRVQVVPVTSNIRQIYSAECLVKIQKKQNKAMADQLTTISKLRLISKLGFVTSQEMESIERIILLQLGIQY